MTTISMMSSLNSPDQKGGAYLRVDAIRNLYEDIGFKTNLFYHEDFTTRNSLKSLIKSLRYHPNTRIIFKTSNRPIPDANYLHFDNLRHFSWKYNPNIPILFNAHNLEFENYFNREETKESYRFKNYEFDQMTKAKCIWLCSQREKKLLNEARPNTTDKSFVIPNMVKSNDYFSNKKKYISFIGTLDYYPNILAIDFILDELIPSLDKKKLNGYEFIIAGRNPLPSQIEKCKEKKISLKTNLEKNEILKLFAETKILLVPLTKGSGTRLKIIEGIFSNCYILSTKIGSEGIESKYITIKELSEFKNSLLNIINSSSSENFVFENKFMNQFDLNSWIKQNKTKIQKAITR